MTRKRVAKPPAKRAAAPTVIPQLTECPGCGVELEAGKGPHGLAWHVCRSRPSTADQTEADVLAAMRDAAKEAKPSELIALLAAVREHKRASTKGEAAEPDREVADWIQRKTRND